MNRYLKVIQNDNLTINGKQNEQQMFLKRNTNYICTQKVTVEEDRSS